MFNNLFSITMQSSKLLIFSCFALAATVGASTSFPPVPTPSSVSFTPLSSCTLGGDASCSTGSVCTPAGICIGRCYSGISSPTILPTTSNIAITTSTPVNTCQIGVPANENGCSSGSYCLPTQTCPGLCINTVPLPPMTTTTVPTTLPSTPPSGITTPPTSSFSAPSVSFCVYDQDDTTEGCPTSSVCTPIQPCDGICFTTTSPFSVGTGCTVLANDCGPNAYCSQNAGCEGACIASPATTITDTYITPTTTPKTTPTPTSTLSVPTPSGTCGWVYIPCGVGYKCVNQFGVNCALGESGHCVPVRQAKHRFLAGRYFDAGEE